MTSPDVAGYTGLTLVDVDAQGLFDQAIARLVEVFPEYVAREGHTEVVVLEAVTSVVEDLVYAINQLPDGMAEVLLRLFGLTRSTGVPPTCTVSVTLIDDAGHTIPIGTVVRLDPGSGDPVDFITTDELVVPEGQTSGTVAAAATVPTIAANGKPAGTTLDLLDAITWVESVVLASDVTGGSVAEDGDAFLARTTPVLQRLNNTLVRPGDFVAYVPAAHPEYVRVSVVDMYDPGSGNDPGEDLGHVSVAVAKAGGVLLSGGDKTALAAELAARALAGLTVHVIDPTVTAVDVTMTVLRKASAVSADVIAAVVAALQEYLNPDAWDWGGLVRVNELIGRADAAAGVDVVLSVSDPADDLALPGVAPLAVAGTISVTVDAP